MTDDETLLEEEKELYPEIDFIKITEELEEEYEEDFNRKHRLWSRNPEMKDLREEIGGFDNIGKIKKMFENGSIEFIRGLRSKLQRMFEIVNKDETAQLSIRDQWTFENINGEHVVLADPFFISDWLSNEYELDKDEVKQSTHDIIDRNRKDLVDNPKSKLDQLHKLSVLILLGTFSKIPGFEKLSKKDHKYLIRLVKVMFNVMEIDCSELEEIKRVRI